MARNTDAGGPLGDRTEKPHHKDGWFTRRDDTTEKSTTTERPQRGVAPPIVDHTHEER